MTKTTILGPEHDAALSNALQRVLGELGAQHVSGRWGVGGSQEVRTQIFTIDAEPVAIESETYVGLSVTGEEGTVDTLAARVREILRGQ